MSGKIPQEFIDSLLAQTDIVDVIDAKVPLKKTGNNYTACCPFHNEKSPSFSVSQSKQFYYCFGCKASGSAIGFLMQHDNLTFLQAVEVLAAGQGLVVPRQDSKHESYHVTYEILNAAAEYFAAQLRTQSGAHAVAYLKKRGLSGQMAKKFMLGYAPKGWQNLFIHLKSLEYSQRDLVAAGVVVTNDKGKQYDRFRDRVMFPIRDSAGRVVGFGGRVLDEGQPKYLNSAESPVFNKRKLLYGEYELDKSAASNQVLVVEGYMDVIALAQHGLKFGLATLGTAVGVDHVIKLLRKYNKIVFCFDGDLAGQQAAAKALDLSLSLVRPGKEICFLLLPSGQDPDSYINAFGAQKFQQAIDSAEPLSEFLLASVVQHTDLTTIDGRAKFLALMRPLVTKMPKDVYRSMVEAKVASLAQIDLALLHRNWEQAAKPTAQKPRPLKAQTPSNNTQDFPSVNMSRLTLMQRATCLALQVTSLGDLDEGLLKPLQASSAIQAKLLLAVIEQRRQVPGQSMAALLSTWSDVTQLDYLAALATKDFELTEPQLLIELAATLAKISSQAQEALAQELIILVQERGLEALTAQQRADFDRIFSKARS